LQYPIALFFKLARKSIQSNYYHLRRRVSRKKKNHPPKMRSLTFVLFSAAAWSTCLARPSSFEFIPTPKSATALSQTGFPNLQATVRPQTFADTFGAKCLDGTPPAFFSLIQDPQRWILFIEGGGWCFSLSDCAGRASGGGGSSNGYAGTSMDVGGLLSPDPSINPRFYNYSFVFIHYCGAFGGQATRLQHFAMYSQAAHAH
jgi:hypothetical protein